MNKFFFHFFFFSSDFFFVDAKYTWFDPKNLDQVSLNSFKHKCVQQQQTEGIPERWLAQHALFIHEIYALSNGFRP